MNIAIALVRAHDVMHVHARAIAFLQVHTGLLLFVLSCMHTIFVLMHA